MNFETYVDYGFEYYYTDGTAVEKIIDVPYKEIKEEPKKIDLTFVRFAQRKRAALDYIENIEKQRDYKNIKTNNIREFIENALGAIGVFGIIFGIYFIGSFF